VRRQERTLFWKRKDLPVVGDSCSQKSLRHKSGQSSRDDFSIFPEIEAEIFTPMPRDFTLPEIRRKGAPYAARNNLTIAVLVPDLWEELVPTQCTSTLSRGK
jgi:hypothetical protein